MYQGIGHTLASFRDSAAHLSAPLLASSSISPSHFACQGFQGDLCPELQCQQRTQQNQTGSRAELGQGQRRQLSVKLTRACFSFWQETSRTGQCPGLGGTSGLLVDGFKMSQWELVSCLQPSCGWQMGGTLSRLRAPIQTRGTQHVLGHASTMGCPFGQKVPTQPWGTHPVTGYPPPRPVQGKWWEWGVPADTWDRKDLLGLGQGKTEKKRKPLSASAQHSSTQADAPGTSHISIAVSLSSTLMTTEGRGAEKWGGHCHC